MHMETRGWDRPMIFTEEGEALSVTQISRLPTSWKSGYGSGLRPGYALCPKPVTCGSKCGVSRESMTSLSPLRSTAREDIIQYTSTMYSTGGYEVIGKLAFGQFSTVWLAHNQLLQRHVALKILKADVSRNNKELAMFLKLSAPGLDHGLF
ncbi:uncharacterized protein PADG_08356 [Paracoccidioides brasiliensis Pb18]|uniref:Protein kinase domain-containing protein n=2 Tax=Paracoccidioides brasiliensis TaxID=121759 RepID=C1GLW5_PARBD|nr:uncharacterized protein PADG_08356 [Paracoccidioides brasiliensis Pb18]EEH43431.2 hypothetical protein PADG_08356 [Paracoccidioides brasiliensis Pb18]